VSLKVLLADDSVPAQNMGKKILVDAGYEVLTASNGLEALRKIVEAPPDIAILDIFMPGYSGLEVCSRLRNAAPTATLPVILTVGKMEPYRAEDGEQVHSNAVVVKPFAATELIAAVRSLIGESPAEVHPQAGAESPQQEPDDDPLQTDPLHADLPRADLSQDDLSHADLPKEGHAAAMPGEFPVLASGGTLAAEPLSEASHGRVDEPFSLGDSAVEVAEPLNASAPSAYRDSDPLSDGVESSGPESLVYNPDAVRTPFRASAAESLPEFPTVDSESPFGEFDLLADPSPYPAAPGPELSSADEPLFAAPESDESPLETAAPGEAPQASIAQVEAAHASSDAHPPAAQLVSEMETRTPAPEGLNYSTEPSPLDELPAPPAEVLPDEPSAAETKSVNIDSFALPSTATNRSPYSPFGVQMDLENEPLATSSQAEFIASTQDVSQSSLDQMELEPISTGEPSEEPLQEEAESNWGATESVLEPMEAAGTDLSLEPLLAAGSAPEAGSAAIPETPEAPMASVPELLAEAEPPELQAIPTEPEPLAAVAPPETHEAVLEPAKAVAEAVPEAIAAAPEPAAAEAQVAPPLLEIAAADVEPNIAPEAKAVELEPEPVPVPIAAEHETIMEPQVSVPPELVAAASHQSAISAMEAHAENISSAPEVEQQPLSQQSQSQQFLDKLSDEEIIRVAVDRVFDRFKGLLVKAILRELKRPE
jgi:CheY-like chemotaxis protein